MKGRNDHLAGDDEQGKLFVGGLSWETTQESLQRYFSRYGEVIDCVVMKNSESGRSRGFGFVTFADPSIVGMVLQNGPHQLDGRTIDPKACNPRTMQKKKVGSYPKVFLGGLPSNVTETDLRSFFNRYGIVMEVVIMYDQEKKKSRGFGFLSFEDDDAVDRCVSDHFVNLNGKQVEIKRAEPRDNKPGSELPNWSGPNTMNMGLQSMGMGMGANGPMANLGSIGPMQGYQGWNSTPPTGYGYGAPSTPGGYQGWGGPAGPAGPQSPPQWGSSYGTTPPQSGYASSYGAQTTQQAGYASNWNWNMPQNGPSGGAPQTVAPPHQSDVYSRGGMGASTGGQIPSGSVAPKTEYPGYGGYQSYQQDTSPYGGGRNYGVGDSGPQGFGMINEDKLMIKKEWPSS